MKKIMIGLIALTSLSAFAQTAKVVCGNGRNNSDQSLKMAISNAESNLNNKLTEYYKVIRASAPTIHVLNDEKFRTQHVAICVTVESK